MRQPPVTVVTLYPLSASACSHTDSLATIHRFTPAPMPCTLHGFEAAMDVPFPGSAQRNNRCEKQASSQQETHMSVAGGGASVLRDNE